jgi:hypothetical protein
LVAVTVTESYLDAAAVAVELLADRAVAAAWREPSALEKLSVGGLAAHLSRQITLVPERLDEPPPDTPPVSLIDHYGRVTWAGADIDSETNVAIRRLGEQGADSGAEAVLAQTRAALADLRRRLPAEPATRPFPAPAGWALTLQDFLVTRMLEISVHCDDLAVSVGVATPPMPAEVIDPVLDLLCRLAVRRHGATPVLRALSRAERAPATIAAI